MRVRRRRQSLSQPESQPEEIDLIHHRNRSSTTKFGDFHHGTSRLLSRLETKLTFPSPTTTTTGARGPRFHRRRGTVHLCSIANTFKLEEAQVVPPFHTSYYNYIVATERTDDKPTVYSYRQQWNPCHMDFGLVPASH